MAGDAVHKTVPRGFGGAKISNSAITCAEESRFLIGGCQPNAVCSQLLAKMHIVGLYVFWTWLWQPEVNLSALEVGGTYERP